MDPNSGRLYTAEQMAAMDQADREGLVELRGKRADVERISEAVKRLNRAERRAANRKAGLRSNGDPK